MPKLLVIASLLLLMIDRGLSQGALIYQTTGEREVWVFMPDPSAPTVAKHGGRLSDYIGFDKVEGPGFYAELWWAAGEGQPEESLGPVPGSLVTFKTAPNGGLITGRSKLEIPGTFGGDRVTLQLRVWENFAQTVQTWEEAMNSGSTYGKSNLFVHELTGLDPNGNPKLGTGTIRNDLRVFSLVIPEPSMLGLLLATMSVGMVRGRRK